MFSKTEVGHAQVSIHVENTGMEYLIMKVIENAEKVAIILICGARERNIIEFNSNIHLLLLKKRYNNAFFSMVIKTLSVKAVSHCNYMNSSTFLALNFLVLPLRLCHPFSRSAGWWAIYSWQGLVGSTPHLFSCSSLLTKAPFQSGVAM